MAPSSYLRTAGGLVQVQFRKRTKTHFNKSFQNAFTYIHTRKQIHPLPSAPIILLSPDRSRKHHFTQKEVPKAQHRGVGFMPSPSRNPLRNLCPSTKGQHIRPHEKDGSQLHKKVCTNAVLDASAAKVRLCWTLLPTNDLFLTITVPPEIPLV